MEKNVRIVIVTGLSGSGKTTTLKVLEDLGFYCVDNLPPVLFPVFIQLCEGFTWQKISRIAIGMDIREREFLREYPRIFEQLRLEGYEPEILFLESSDEILVRRFSETRRQHPLSDEGSLLDGIRLEREQLSELKKTAAIIIDTSRYTVHNLREEVYATFHQPHDKPRMSVNLISFGFRYGIPYDADLLVDVRFLPNPYFVEELRFLTGNNDKIKTFVLEKEQTAVFLQKFKDLLQFLLPLYEKEGKSNLTIAIGCTGGRHRSVSIVNALREFFFNKTYSLRVLHRDEDKG
ncbi:MAG TPA: RNase adapter RapZ [Thermodesulfobacteriota bacterium]|nr:RNase adapter RapZ [Deltaproteobacteria bacterium]HNU71197.1 RNase adapter RapZ [Thermodesulfobacteriota bacterium]